MPDDQIRLLMDSIRPRLVKYLENFDIEAGSGANFNCISKYHVDRSPSMRLIPESGGCTLYCYSCAATMDIFTAAHHLENRPLDGTEFIHENVFYLADLFSIDRSNIEVAEREVNLIKARKLYKDTVEVFLELATFEHTDALEWPKELCRELGVGTVQKSKDLYDGLVDRGWDLNYLVSQGVRHSKDERVPRLFGADRLTFVLNDHKGQPVGFIAKNLTDKGPRYLNTREKTDKRSGSVLYSKKRLLYGLDTASQAQVSRVDVVEGCSDLMTMRTYGIKNVVAMCGSSFSPEQFQLLVNAGFTHINLVMDNDETGYVKMFGKKKDEGYIYYGQDLLHVRVTASLFDVEEEDNIKDPDDFLRKYSVDDYQKKLTLYEPFDWDLKKLLLQEPKPNPHTIVERLIPYLVSEGTLTSRVEKVRKLAESTGIPREDIQAEYDYRFDLDVGSMVSRLSRTIGSPVLPQAEKLAAIDNFRTTLEAKSAPRGADISQIEVVKSFDSFVDTIQAESRAITGFDCLYPGLNEAMNGVPKSEQVIAFPGNTNVGKSATLINLAVNLCRCEENKSLTCCVWPLDDSRHETLAKFLAVMSNNEINHCKAPHQHIFPFAERRARFEEALGTLREWIESGRLSMKGEEMGSKTYIGERWVKATQDQTGNHVILFVDSFNNVEWKNETDELTKQLKVSSWLRQSTASLGYTAITSMELNKMGIYESRARLKHIRGSGKMQYDLKFVGMFFNDLHENHEKAQMIWRDEDGVIKPIIEIYVEKNKLAGFKHRSLYYKFRPERVQLTEISKAEAIEFARSVIQEDGFDIEADQDPSGSALEM